MKHLQLTDEILAKLVGIAAASGIDIGIAAEGTDIGDLRPVIPAVSLNRATSEIAHETGLNLKNSGLYAYGETNKRLITVSQTGKEEDMDADRFRTWIDQFQLNYYKKRKKSEDDEGPGVPVKATMKADVARVMLRSDEFIGHLPVIKRILPVRLPVWEIDDDGTKKVRLLPYGYDAESQIYTQNTGVEYLEMWTLDAAVKYIMELLGEFPYGDDGRSLAVQIAAMLTMYCTLLLGDRDRSPLIYYNANQPGSGKSRLAEMCIYPIYGTADPLTYADNDEFTKKLDTWAQAGELYAFLDDVSGLVKSNDLNRWVTSPTWSGRVMHSQKTFSVFNQKLTLLTGNQATLSEDLTRRALMVDLWSSELASDRQSRFSRVIDAEWLAQPDNRGNILSALYALVKNWVDSGATPHPTVLPSFEGWSRIVPAIVTAAAFKCPLEKPNVQDAGGKQQVEFLRLLEAAVMDYTPEGGLKVNVPVDILLTDWCRLARWKGVFHAIVSDTPTMREVLDASPKLYKPVKDENGVPREMTEDDKNFQASRYLDKSMSTKFGGLLNKFYRGQIRTINGQRIQFAEREAKFSTFAITLLVDEPRPDNEPF
jgi:hypothetical protein